MQDVQVLRSLGLRFWSELPGPLSPCFLSSGVLVSEKQMSVRAITPALPGMEAFFFFFF